jgi:hypothetical protein
MNSRLRFAILALGSLLLGIGCRIVTPQELANFESHPYPGHSQAEVYGATVTALKSIGYEIVLADKGSFRIKTAPKVVMVHAAATSSSTAVALNDTVGWNIDVLSSSDGAILHAEPRLYRGGNAVEPSTILYDFADNLFRTLYAEIDSDMPAGGSKSSASPALSASKGPAPHGK